MSGYGAGYLQIMMGLSWASTRNANYTNVGILPITPALMRDYGIKENSILARFFSTEFYSVEDIRGVLRQFWGFNIGFQIRQTDPNLFIITFRTAKDLKWIALNEPWYPYGNVLSAKSASPGMQISTEAVKEISLWDSISNCNREHRLGERLGLIASRIGVVSQVCNVSGDFDFELRVLVWVNIENLLS